MSRARPNRLSGRERYLLGKFINSKWDEIDAGELDLKRLVLLASEHLGRRVTIHNVRGTCDVIRGFRIDVAQGKCPWMDPNATPTV